ncbi:MAG: FAD:protein FMN transferase [Pseudohongiellaceae bacterium]
MHLIRRFRYTLTFLALFLGWLWLRPEPGPAVYQLQGQTMGTTYSIRLWEFPEAPDQETFAARIQEQLDRLDTELMSLYAEDSQISRFNRTEPGEWFAVADEVIDVIRVSEQVSELSGGAFDVTVAPLVQRWGFAETPGAADQGVLPSDRELESLRRQVDYRQLEWRRSAPALRKQSALRVDLGGVAKGYAVDVLAGYFDSLALDSYFIEIGGEIRLRGTRPDGGQWVPAIERPGAGREAQAVIDPAGRPLALAGSGDYRNFFIADGQRYSHEIDPRTGRPVEGNLTAVYVISDTAVMADALSTAFMAMGLDEARRLAEERDLAAFFIYRVGSGDDTLQDHMTPAFAGYLER